MAAPVVGIAVHIEVVGLVENPAQEDEFPIAEGLLPGQLLDGDAVESRPEARGICDGSEV